MNSLSSSICVIETDELDSRQFPKVTFTGVEKHPSTEDLECHLQFNGDFVPSSEDYVGIICIEYKSLSQCLVHQNITNLDEQVQVLIFSANSLPQDESDFYQFIYVSGNTVIGNSAEFYIHASNGDISSGEDDEYMSIISVEQQSVPMKLYEQLLIKCQHLEKKNQLLSQCSTALVNKDYEARLEEKQKLLTCLLEENGNLKLMLKKMKNEIQMLTTSHESKMKEAEEKSQLKSEVEKIKHQMESLRKAHKTEVVSLKARYEANMKDAEEQSQLKSELEETKRQMKSIEEAHGTKTISLKTKYETLIKKSRMQFSLVIEKMNSQIMSLKKAHTIEIEKIKRNYEDQLMDKERKMKSSIEEKALMMKSLQDIHENEVRKLKEGNQICLIENQELLNSVVEADENMKFVNEIYRKDLADLEGENRRIHSTMKSLRSKIESIQDEKHAAVIEKTNMSFKLKSMEEQNDLLQKLIKKEANVSDLLDRIDQYEETINGLQLCKTVLQEEIIQLRRGH